MIGNSALLDLSVLRKQKEAKTSERNGQQKSAKENPLLQREKETDVYFFSQLSQLTIKAGNRTQDLEALDEQSV
jgi:hypothetical protein